jgi:exodeoxyribonuclease V alpha subunit
MTGDFAARFFTGLTRGRRLVVLVGQRQAIAIVVRNVSGRRRWTRLLAYLTSLIPPFSQM